MWTYNYTDELYHYGIKGMKWGRRKARLTIGNRHHTRAANSVQKDADNLRKHGYKSEADAVQKVADKHRQKAAESQNKHDSRTPMSTKKKVGIGAAAVVGTALAAYGGYKVSGILKDKAFKKAYEKGEKTAVDYLSRYHRTTVYPGNDRQLSKAIQESNRLNREFSQKNLAYANRASRNTISAIKTLRGKNYELTPAELRRLGIKTF